MSGSDSELNHWADHAAKKTLRAHPDAKVITVAAGITPSGTVHVGNFREVMTVDLVARALRDHGATVRFIYSWDDFDVFRKVPKDLPKQELLAENLGRSIVDVPDPFDEYESYADRHVSQFQGGLPKVGIQPEFIRQHAKYRAGDYAEGIRKALDNKDAIRTILNDARKANGAKTLLDEDWLPLSGFCDSCGADDLELHWDGEWTVSVSCRKCGHKAEVDFRKGGNLKLPWRVDWPMRWGYEQVCFEPGGKDHSSAGGSYDTAKDIVRQVYDWTAPEYVGYDFVRVKGQGGKISSSRGGVVTVEECLEIYEPRVLRWMFASYRPNTEFQISFDLDVIKIYEDFDRALRLAHAADEGTQADKKRQVARRTMHLASVDHTRPEPGSAPPNVPPFRQLSVILQIFGGDVDRTCEHLASAAGEARSEADQAHLRARATCVGNWLEHYAPEEFRYTIRDEPVARELGEEHKTALGRLVEILRADPGITDVVLGKQMKGLVEGIELELKQLYPVAYDLLIGRDHGPRLNTLIATMGSERALALLTPSLG